MSEAQKAKATSKRAAKKAGAAAAKNAAAKGAEAAPAAATPRESAAAPPPQAALEPLVPSLDPHELAAQVLKLVRTQVHAAGSGGREGGTPDPALNKNSIKEEHRLNIEAHRRKRWAAFGVAGFVSFAFFALLFFILHRLFFTPFIAEAVGAANGSWQAMVMLGALVALVSAIPLSLALALVKMISERGQEPEDDSDLKAPGVELARAIIDLCKSVTAALSR